MQRRISIETRLEFKCHSNPFTNNEFLSGQLVMKVFRDHFSALYEKSKRNVYYGRKKPREIQV